MPFLRPWLPLAIAVACVACSDGKKGTTADSVGGGWCGLDVATAAACAGDDALYLELTQTETAVAGRSCEAIGRDCAPVENGAFFDGELTFDFTFTDGTVDATLMLSGDGRSLSGKLASTKCACDIPVTLHRLD